jgi:hypothetical protein
MRPQKYYFNFRFFDTEEQAEAFKTWILEEHKNNRYYMRTYANAIEFHKITDQNGGSKIILYYYF